MNEEYIMDQNFLIPLLVHGLRKVSHYHFYPDAKEHKRHGVILIIERDETLSKEFLEPNLDISRDFLQQSPIPVIKDNIYQVLKRILFEMEDGAVLIKQINGIYCFVQGGLIIDASAKRVLSEMGTDQNLPIKERAAFLREADANTGNLSSFAGSFRMNCNIVKLGEDMSIRVFDTGRIVYSSRYPEEVLLSKEKIPVKLIQDEQGLFNMFGGEI